MERKKKLTKLFYKDMNIDHKIKLKDLQIIYLLNINQDLCFSQF